MAIGTPVAILRDKKGWRKMRNDNSSSKIKAGYEWVTNIFDYLRSPLLLAMRLFWGWQFFIAGKGKLLNLDQTVDFFTQLGLPFPQLNAILAGSTECIGGLLLLLGLGSRLISIPLAFTMVVAYLTADREALMAIITKPDDFVAATPFLFLLTSLIVLAFGPGYFSIDTLIGKFTGKKKREVIELRRAA